MSTAIITPENMEDYSFNPQMWEETLKQDVR